MYLPYQKVKKLKKYLVKGRLGYQYEKILEVNKGTFSALMKPNIKQRA